MAYFTQDFLDFFKELDKNNAKDWFDKNRKRYEKSVKDPFKAFVEDMIFRMNSDNPAINIQAKDAIFRINRDIRFSSDKTPYKIHTSAIVAEGGKKNKTVPGIYFQLNHVDSRIYSGVHMVEKDVLQNVREHIAANLNEFDSLVNDKKFKKYFGDVLGEKNKRLPKEFQEIEKKQPLIANKGWYYFAKFPPKTALDPKLPDIFMEHWKVAKPLNEFFVRGMN
ncbi:DUF2461 domain-containing protein [bacterium AH-315-C07]|nr:DUF2461 domain-containing protein [bacterium AH-315-C07]